MTINRSLKGWESETIVRKDGLGAMFCFTSLASSNHSRIHGVTIVANPPRVGAIRTLIHVQDGGAYLSGISIRNCSIVEQRDCSVLLRICEANNVHRAQASAKLVADMLESSLMDELAESTTNHHQRRLSPRANGGSSSAIRLSSFVYINASRSNVMIQECTFENNHGIDNAIMIRDSHDVVIVESRFAYNNATFGAVGIQRSSNVLITRCDFDGNRDLSLLPLASGVSVYDQEPDDLNPEYAHNILSLVRAIIERLFSPNSTPGGIDLETWVENYLRRLQNSSMPSTNQTLSNIVIEHTRFMGVPFNFHHLLEDTGRAIYVDHVPTNLTVHNCTFVSFNVRWRFISALSSV